MSAKPILMNTEKDLMQEPGAFYNGIIANITDEAIEFENRCMGEALRRWQISKEDVLARIREADKLRAETEKLRAELEQIPSCIYYKQGGLCRYGGDDPANVCVLGPCDHDVSVQDVLTELEQVKAERDAIEQDFRDFTKQWWEEDSGFPCRWCKFENAGSCEWKVKCQSEEKICAGRAFKWRGKKEG